MIESTGISGRLPVLSLHMNEPHSEVVQVTWNTWPGSGMDFAHGVGVGPATAIRTAIVATAVGVGVGVVLGLKPPIAA